MGENNIMIQLINQEIYTESGRLKHLVNDKKLEFVLKELNTIKQKVR